MNAFTEGDVEKKLTVYECPDPACDFFTLMNNSGVRECFRDRHRPTLDDPSPRPRLVAGEYVPEAALSEAVGRADGLAREVEEARADQTRQIVEALKAKGRFYPDSPWTGIAEFIEGEFGG